MMRAKTTQPAASTTAIGLTNGLVQILFDRRTGALVSLKNLVTNDEYLKERKQGGNPFRGYIDPTKLPLTTEVDWSALAGYPEGTMGGKPIEPVNCRLLRHDCRRIGKAGHLRLELRHKNPLLAIRLDVCMPDGNSIVDCSLKVKNLDSSTHQIAMAFPYFTGLCLGNDWTTNLGVRMFGAGLPGEQAWINSGGTYGYQVAMQWQSVYEPALKEGFAFIVMDEAVRPKTIRRFPGGGMSALYFLPEKLRTHQALSYPAVRLIVHQGNWRRAAREYRKWFDTAFNPRRPPAWLSEVNECSSVWMPDADSVAKAQKCADVSKLCVWMPDDDGVAKTQKRRGGLKSFHDVTNSFYLPRHFDALEWAMYWEGVCVHRPSPYMPDGTYHPRHDLGGVEAMREAIDDLHRIGRRVILYVAGHGVMNDSNLFRGTNPEQWEQMIQPGQVRTISNIQWKVRPGEDLWMCPGYKPWQDHLAAVCRRLLRETGADGIRLDEVVASELCFNPAHHHRSPYDSNQWHRELLRKVRAAMDKVNPDALLLTEGIMDFFNESANGALVMFYPGHEIEPLRVALPYYQGVGYHTGIIEPALNGWIVGERGAGAADCHRLTASRESFPWAGTPGWPARPKWLNKPPVLTQFQRWHELRSMFQEVRAAGEVTDDDPVAMNDPRWVGRLWKTSHYWLLVGAREDASSLQSAVRIKLPELPAGMKQGYAIDAETLSVKTSRIRRDGENIFVTMTSTFGVVLFPKPKCPPLIRIVEETPILKAGKVYRMGLSAFAPWGIIRSRPRVTIKAFGMDVLATSLALPARFVIRVPRDICPGMYYLTIRGNCLPLKRWIKIEA